MIQIIGSINWYVTKFALIYVKWQQDNKYSSNRAWENRRGAVVVTASGKSSRLLWKTIDAWLNVNELCIKTFYCSKNHFCKEEITQVGKFNLSFKRSFFLESNLLWSFISGSWKEIKFGFGDLDLKKGVDHDLKLEKGEVWNKI